MYQRFNNNVNLDMFSIDKLETKQYFFIISHSRTVLIIHNIRIMINIASTFLNQ